MLSKILFTHVSPIIKRGQKKTIELNDLPELPELWDPKKYVSGFDRLTGEHRGKGFILETFNVLKPQAKRLFLFILVMIVLKMASPILIHSLISAVGKAAKGEISLLTGILTAGLLCIVQLANALIGQHYIYHAVTSTQSAINGINQRIYTAILRSRKNENRKGQVINRAGSDAEMAGACLWVVAEMFQITLTALATSSLLFYFLGTAAIAPLVLMLLLMPLSKWFSGQFARLQSDIMKNRDQRVGRMAQFLDGIRVIKSFVWEKVVRSEISDLRQKEMSTWKKLAAFRSVSTGSYLFASLCVSLLAFGIYIYQGNTLTSATAFTCLTLFGYLEPCIRQMPKLLGELTSSFVAGERLSDIIKEEKKSFAKSIQTHAIELDNVTVHYDEQRDALKKISLSIKEGESIAVIGGVGSGKTTFLKSILGELSPAEGNIFKREAARFSFVPQDPFLFHGTLKDNIDFGNKDIPQESLMESLHVSCLEHDLEMMPDGLSTELAEGGGNLSGGQKQRVNLARAAAWPGDLILLDDPLSALDPKTEKQIIDRLIFGHWKNQTRIVTTHRLAHLRRFDRILFLDRGEVVAFGTFEELKDLSEFKRFFTGLKKEEETAEVPVARKTFTPVAASTQSKVVEDEEQKSGEVSLLLYWNYFKAMADFSKEKLPRTLALLFMTSLSAMVFPIFQNSWLSKWTETLSNGTGQSVFYLSVYALLGLAATCICVFQQYYWSVKAVDAAESLHKNALDGILSTVLRFFDANPSGRILNRFSRDLDAIEKDLSWSLDDAIMAFLNSLGAVCVMLFALPFMGFVVLPVVAIYYFLQKAYRTCMRETKRLMSVARSPRIMTIKEVLDGASVIRCYQAEDFFRNRFSNALFDYQRAFYGVVLINRWFSIRIPLVSSLLSLAACIGVILMARFAGVTEGVAGMALVYAFRFWDSLNWTVRAFGEAEAQMTSVERLESLSVLARESEKEAIVYDSQIRGEIAFNNVFAAYAPHLPDVLKGTDFYIEAGSKVGVVGRTGAGKSTLFSLLHRFIEAREGEIKIDGKNIKEFPLKMLRESIGTIPQNPVLFAGTIRENLDPLNYYKEEDLLRVLRIAHLDFLCEGLGTKVAEGGSNFSRGQKQLICLARALVRESRIIIVDEATASVDGKTDALIRKILMNDCPGITVLIIAHKLQSVSQCDMIIEMRDGKVLEITHPTPALPELVPIPA